MQRPTLIIGLILAQAIFVTAPAIADECGNSPEFLAAERERAGLGSESSSRKILKAARQSATSVQLAPLAAAPYTGSSALGEPLNRSLVSLLNWGDQKPVITDLEQVRTEEQYINKGKVDKDDPEADQDGWVVEQRGFFDFDFHVFNVSIWNHDPEDDYDDIEFLVNTELSKSEAVPLIERTAAFLQSMAASGVTGIETMVIHKAENGRATGSPYRNTMTIYTNTINGTDRAFSNTLWHELAHISVEENFYNAEGTGFGSSWYAAAEKDGGFLTEYAETNPDTEDIAETWVPFVRLKFTSDFASSAQAATITKQVPNRLAFFESVTWGEDDGWFWPVSSRNFWLGDKESAASLEEPVNGGIHSGISNIRGWAVSTRGVGRVAVYVDGRYAFEAPLGGARGDVGRIFPDAKDSKYSGFGLTYNYGGLSPGAHTMTIRAYGLDGSVTESSSTFTVASYHSEFFGADKPVNLGNALLNASGDELTVQGAKIDGQNYDLVLKWQVPSQSFQVISAE